MLPEILGEADSFNLVVGGGEFLDDLPYAIGAAVVYQYNLVVGAGTGCHGVADFLHHGFYGVFATVTGDYKREFHLKPLLNGFPLVTLCGLRGGLHHGEAFERGVNAAYVLACKAAGREILAEAVGDVFVVVRESFDESGGVAGFKAVVALLVCNFDVAGAVAQAYVATQVAGLERFGLQLKPFGAAFTAVYADAQAVAVAECGFAEPNLRANVVGVLRQRAHVIDNLREKPEGGLVGHDVFGAFAGQKVNHVVQVAAEVE